MPVMEKKIESGLPWAKQVEFMSPQLETADTLALALPAKGKYLPNLAQQEGDLDSGWSVDPPSGNGWDR
jgi:hypothetical protein